MKVIFQATILLSSFLCAHGQNSTSGNATDAAAGAAPEGGGNGTMDSSTGEGCEMTDVYKALGFPDGWESPEGADCDVLNEAADKVPEAKDTCDPLVVDAEMERINVEINEGTRCQAGDIKESKSGGDVVSFNSLLLIMVSVLQILLGHLPDANLERPLSVVD